MKAMPRFIFVACLLAMSTPLVACESVPAAVPGKASSLTAGNTPALSPVVSPYPSSPPATVSLTWGPTPLPTAAPLPTALPRPPSAFDALWFEFIPYGTDGPTQPRGVLWLADPRDVASRTRILDIDQEIMEAALSPDHKHLAFVTTDWHVSVRPLWVVNVDGTELKQLAPSAIHPFWSRDSRTISYYVENGQQDLIEQVDLATGDRRQVLTILFPSGLVLLGWSANDQWFYYARHGTSGYELWEMSKDGSKSQKLADLGTEIPYPGYLLLSPDSSGVLSGNTHGLDWISIDGRQRETIPIQRPDRGYLIRWDSVGDEVVVGQFDENEHEPIFHINAINVRTGRIRELGKFRPFSTYDLKILGVSPDSKWIAISEPKAAYFVYLPQGLVIPVPPVDHPIVFASWVASKGIEP